MSLIEKLGLSFQPTSTDEAGKKEVERQKRIRRSLIAQVKKQIIGRLARAIKSGNKPAVAALLKKIVASEEVASEKADGLYIMYPTGMLPDDGKYPETKAEIVKVLSQFQ